MEWIDVRSDTVTQPTPAMRAAMAEAVVGDDVYGDDPAVASLEAAAAERLGKAAALFVPTGTFGNQLAMFTHCERGDEVIVAEDSHIVWHEVGGAAIIAGVNLRPVPVLNGDAVRTRIRPGGDIHLPRTGLVCVENARGAGSVMPLATMREIHEVANHAGIPVHLDGARLFNAAVALGVEARELAQYADSVMFCLSKGLAAPVGSILAGPAGFIEKARKKRKLMGGGMRQAGVLAAPGLIALNDMSARLGDDHANARRLAELLEKLPGVVVHRDQLQINMVFFELLDIHQNPDDLVAKLLAQGIKANPPEDGLWRFVTHWQTGPAEVERVAQAFGQALLH
ncbi:threonine aldolase family protein [Jeongeupia naejangsanensis]|uniref:Threonine aldolase family protein n=1 Tax=Jeongeupia naejangsanensis TaxID=613195 RepID=A0ABS2BHV0_9NEIS|nr:threonine aldolase family protein [Jeongeupia naejangsanensis]MBM3115182.1 threonine aldolase family protein [Jeongeupia naejangsanensis]